MTKRRLIIGLLLIAAAWIPFWLSLSGPKQAGLEMDESRMQNEQADLVTQFSAGKFTLVEFFAGH